MRYYQGYHDVAITFLLVVGEAVAFRIMDRLSTDHLRECMEPTMERTSYRLNYMYPLLQKVDPPLYDFMERFVYFLFLSSGVLDCKYYNLTNVN